MVYNKCFVKINVLLIKENTFSIPEGFNTNISHQLFNYTITFVNSQHTNSNLKGDFILKKTG